MLDALHGRASRFVYVSSTSVYGQDDGGWIDEDSETEPTTDGGRICLAAEQQLRSRLANATILRMLGMDHTKLSYFYLSREQRLTDVHGQREFTRRLLGS